jgi:hypothetical protein
MKKNGATSTNAEILGEILEVPILPGLGQNLTEFPANWAGILGTLAR